MDAYWFLHLCLNLMICLTVFMINVQAKDHTIASTSTSNLTSFALPLYHRDDPSGPLRKMMALMEEEGVGRGEVTSRMLRRDEARVEAIRMRVGGGVMMKGLKGNMATRSRSRVGRRHAHVDSTGGENNMSVPVSPEAMDGTGEFYTTMRIGYRDFQLVMDTGSDLVWLQCLPCQSCYDQTDPVFDPRASSTFAPVACGPSCAQDVDITSCRGQACQYQVSYGDGSFTLGSVARENFYVGDNTLLHAGLLMGCGHDNEGLFEGAAGLLGLGRGALSLPSQLSSRTFSYCLSMSGPGSLILGRHDHLHVDNNGSDLVYTPLLSNPVRGSTFYYVPLVGISIAGQMIAGIRAADLSIRPSGVGGVILDSGTVITRLIDAVYYPLRNAFRQAAAMRGYRVIMPFSMFDTCYPVPSTEFLVLPSIELHFEGGSSISLPPENTMFAAGEEELPLLCLAFAPATSMDFSILGNLQQQGFLITFDTEASRIGFLSNQCSATS